MIKCKKFLTALICMCFVVSEMAEIPALAQPEVIVNDTFDDYELDAVPDGWEFSHDSKEEGMWARVLEDPDNPGNKVLGIATIGPLVKGIRHFDPIGGEIHIKFKLRLSYLYNDCHYIGMLDDLTRILTYQNGWNLWDGEEQHVLPNIPVEYDKWLDMEYNIRFSDKTFDIICDGVTWVENYRFKNPDLEQIDSMYFRNGADMMYIDDVIITNDGDIKTMYTKVTSSAYKINSMYQTIKNIPFETTVDEFISNLDLVDGVVVEIQNPDGTPYEGRFIVKNLKLVLKSPEGDQEKAYSIHSRPWIASLLTVAYCKDAIVFGLGSRDAMIRGDKSYFRADDESLTAYKEGDTVYVPLRAIGEFKGLPVIWNSEEASVTLDNVKLYQNDSCITKDGIPINLAGHCVNKNGTIFIPTYWISDMFGFNVLINGNTVIIKENTGFTDSRIEKLVLQEIAERYN